LYWFIPDGLRAEPDVFQVFKWARQGHLPNLKKMMESGSYGYSIPAFPGHTPVNFATLLTGKDPYEHGVTDGPIRLPGYRLKRVTASGFRSSTRKSDTIWNILEEEGLTSAILSVPGSTPPDSDDAIVFKGRWGGWGIDLPSLIFQSENRNTSEEYRHKRALHFEFGQRMTHFVNKQKPSGWGENILQGTKAHYEIEMNAYGNKFFALVVSTLKDEAKLELLLSKDKKTILGRAAVKNWSPWIEVDWSYKLKADKNNFTPSKSEWEQKLSEVSYKTWIKVKPVRLSAGGEFRVRFIIDNLNKYVTQPSYVDDQRRDLVGPFVDFPDNYPAQLIINPEDRLTFLEELDMSFSSHRKLLNFSFAKLGIDAVIHNVYSPNQMLTSRWWLGAFDPMSKHYHHHGQDEKDLAREDILGMYKKVDQLLGDAIDHADNNTVIVLSSDHGVAPLDYEVRLNNLFAKKGWLKFKMNSKTGALEVDWDASQVVYLKMYHIYINPDGLGGVYTGKNRGPKYQKLRVQVIAELEKLKGPDGKTVLNSFELKEDAERFGLDQELVGDLIVSNNVPYNWSESISKDLKVFNSPLVTGYKQAIQPSKTQQLWTPFVIVGPGIKKGYQLGEPIEHKNQLALILKALGIDGERYNLKLSTKLKKLLEK
jgi:predicted AlkP superfamily phosphohydrolase/phosphomutase